MKMNENQIRSLIVAQVLENMAKENAYVWRTETIEQLASQAFMMF